jgi:hypothetical protein
MISEVGRECWRQLGAAMSASTVDLTKPTAREELSAKMTAYVRYAMERPSRYQLLFAPEHAMSEESESTPGLLQPAYRSVITSIERFASEGGILPAKDRITAALVILSLTHGRIALAHLAPWRPGNSPDSVTDFVLESLGQLFGTEEKQVQKRRLQR